MPSNDSQQFPQRAASKRTKLLGVPRTSRSRPGLAVDTSVSRHRGRVPQQVFPYESKTQEQKFVSLSDVRALNPRYGTVKAKKPGSLKQRLEGRVYVRPGQQKSHSSASAQAPVDVAASISSYGTANTDARPTQQAQASLDARPIHKRINGLRPTPLDLSNDVSPSDRAIPIGIAVPSASLSNHTYSPQSSLPHEPSPLRRQSSLRYAQDVNTPTIVITPAREDFDPRFTASPEELRSQGRAEPSSSVYSRYTNGMFQSENTPPVPPLPLFAVQHQISLGSSNMRDSAITEFEDEAPPAYSEGLGKDRSLSICTEIEEGGTPYTSMSFGSQGWQSSQSQVPTPRRSKGWWNVLTSPFSASSASKFASFRSPPLIEEDEREEELILSGASDMGVADPYDERAFTSQSQSDVKLCSAPLNNHRARSFSNYVAMPQRSDTAPGALDIGNADAVNIYRCPSQGAASSYYDQNRRFPSFVEPSTLPAARGLDERLMGWSPSQSVYNGYDTMSQRESFREGAGSTAMTPFGNCSESDFAGFSGTHIAAERGFFSTPSDIESRNFTPRLPTRACSDISEAYDQAFSPMSATPVLENARTATFMRTPCTNGDLRTVELARTPTPGGPTMGSNAATVVSRGTDFYYDGSSIGYGRINEKSQYAPSTCSHSRNSSQGLGISDCSSERSLYPPTKPVSEKPGLGSDRFGQLEVRGTGLQTSDGWRRPWYRRFLWLLIASAALCLISVIVLLVMFIPLHHNDIPVQAQWLNLTGYPPLPTGVATIVGPREVKKVSSCVSPDTLWSCDAPAGKGQSTLGSNRPDFRLLIRFRNQTIADEIVLRPTNSSIEKRGTGIAARATMNVRRNAWTTYLFSSSPSPPSTDDQAFLGRTTDGVSEPYAGEETPFYISLLDPSPLAPISSSELQRRDDRFRYPYPSSYHTHAQSTTSETSTVTSPKPTAGLHVAGDIPEPATEGGNEPAPAELYPFVYAQPLRLFDRGQASEHYGFYTYFDRSIYVKSSSLNGSTSSSLLGDRIESNVLVRDASAVCTWSQTRFLVQIWTQRSDVTSLNSTAGTTDVPAVDSTANDMTAPGSFPYSVTVTLDRHGGDASKKGLYCYGLDDEHHIVEKSVWVDEDRGVGGSLLHPAVVPTNNGNELQRRDSDQSIVIDGGSGGCSCGWQNW